MLRKLAATIVALGALGVLVSCNGVFSAGAFTTVRKNRQLVVGTVPFGPPHIFQKEEQMMGPDAELGRLIWERVRQQMAKDGYSGKIELRWIPRTYSTLAAAVKNSEVQVGLGVYGITEARKKDVVFSRPYYTSRAVLIINPLHQDLRPTQLDGHTVGVRKGTALAELVQKKYNNSKIVPFDTLDDAVLALKRSEIDSIIDDRYMAAYALDTVPGVSHLEIIPGTLAEVECAVAVKKSEHELLRLVNEVVSRVQKGNLEAKWLEEGDAVLARVVKRHGERTLREQRAAQPRRVLIRVSKDRNYDFDIYRMANLRFVLTASDGKRYRCSKLDFKKRVGMSAASVPPGTYKISMPKMNNWTPGDVTILATDPSQITLTIRLQKGGRVIMRRS